MVGLWKANTQKSGPAKICVPEHQKAKVEKVAEKQDAEIAEAQDKQAAFEVKDCFQLHELTVIKGSVIRGMITNKDKLLLAGKSQRIAELWVNDKKVNILNEGETGAIFVKAKGIRLQAGDIVQVE